MQDIKQIIIPILKSYGVPKASLFGSFTRGEQTDKSDVDILIMPPDQMGLEFVELKLDLEDALQREVDLVSYRAIHPRLKDQILASQVLLYES
jgi:predicted nucleotidyltransferase